MSYHIICMKLLISAIWWYRQVHNFFLFCDFYDAVNTFIPWKWLKYNHWHNHTQHPKYNMKQYGNVIEYEFSVSYFSNSKWKEHGFILSYLRCQLHSWYDNGPFVQMKHYQVHHFLFLIRAVPNVGTPGGRGKLCDQPPHLIGDRCQQSHTLKL